MKINIIRKEVNQYRSFRKFQTLMANAGVEEVNHIKDMGVKYLRGLARLKAENPRSFKVACVLEKFTSK